MCARLCVHCCVCVICGNIVCLRMDHNSVRRNIFALLSHTDTTNQTYLYIYTRTCNWAVKSHLTDLAHEMLIMFLRQSKRNTRTRTDNHTQTTTLQYHSYNQNSLRTLAQVPPTQKDAPRCLRPRTLTHPTHFSTHYCVHTVSCLRHVSEFH